MQREKDVMGMLQKSRTLVSGLLSLVGVSIFLIESHPANNPRARVHVEEEMLPNRMHEHPPRLTPTCTHPSLYRVVYVFFGRLQKGSDGEPAGYFHLRQARCFLYVFFLQREGGKGSGRRAR